MGTQEKTLPQDVRGMHIHIVGIKGTGCVALVEILHARGAIITGSDVSERFYTDAILEKLSLVSLPFSEKNITADTQYVIHSSAYSAEKNPDLAEAKQRNIPTLLYTEALGALSRTAYSAGVCGVHGKTTTTGLVGTLLAQTDVPAQVLAGSVISSFGGRCTITAPSFSDAPRHFFVAETCEYQRHFMAFSPKAIILTSVESDHQDYYPTYASIRAAFVEYIEKLPVGGALIYCADDAGAQETARMAHEKRPDVRLIPYGTTAEGDYRLTFGNVSQGTQHFSVAALGACALSVPGEHMVRNATAALALVNELLREDGKNPADYAEKLKAGLLLFAGGKRRSEIIARTTTPLGENLTIIDDYAHHPTAIRTTLAGYRAFYKQHRIITDFMSHTYTRTEALLDDFAAAFSDADRVIINDIYGSAREDASKASVSGALLAERTQAHNPQTVYAGDFASAAQYAFDTISQPSGAADGYLFVTMGAGDNWKVGTLLLEKLKNVPRG